MRCMLLQLRRYPVICKLSHNIAMHARDLAMVEAAVADAPDEAQ